MINPPRQPGPVMMLISKIIWPAAFAFTESDMHALRSSPVRHHLTTAEHKAEPDAVGSSDDTALVMIWVPPFTFMPFLPPHHDEAEVNVTW